MRGVRATSFCTPIIFLYASFLTASLTIYSLSIRHSGGSTESSQHRGVPGERVSAEDTLLLELRPFRVFRIGEVVAYEVPGEGSGDKVESGATGAGSVSKVSGGKEKVYAKIVSIANTSDEGIRRLNVKIGTTVVSVLSTDVFSFKSAREVNLSRGVSGGLRVPGMAAVRRSMFGTKPNNSNSNATAAVPTSTLYGKAAAEEESGSDVSAASRNELLGAVNGLLARAGVPIDLEQQVSMSTIAAFSFLLSATSKFSANISKI